MKSLGKKLSAWVFVMWRPIVVFMALSILFGVVLGFRLGGLNQGASKSEQTYIASATSGKKILDNPVFVIHKIPVYVLSKFDVKRITAYRAVSVLFAISAVVSCFFILREWYTDRIAVLGSWLFLTSAWVLHIGRLATPEASYLLIMPLLWTAVWLYNTTLRKSALLLLSLCAAASLYIPGFVLLVATCAIWKYKHLWKEIKQVPWWFQGLCIASMLLVLAPLLRASFISVDVLYSVIGLPDDFQVLKQMGKNLTNIPVNIFLRGPSDPVRWLGRLPLLDIFSTAMFIIGVYSVRYSLKLTRIQLLLGCTLILIILITLGGLVTITALVPIVYIMIAAGMAFMLKQWFTVFPNNPFARTLATTIVSISVLIVSFYHINHYFIAWPQAPITKQSFGLPIKL